MQLILMILLLATTHLVVADLYEEGRRAAESLQKSQPKTKEQLKSELTLAKKGREPQSLEEMQSDAKQCGLLNSIQEEQNTSVYVFLSFSVPEATWLILSKEVEKVGGVIVIRGLPKNSFKELAFKMHAFRQQGIKATVQIDPRLYTSYDIQSVPCFVTLNNDSFNKLSGNVSLKYALEKMGSEHAIKLRETL